MSSVEPILEARALSFAYADCDAVDGVSLEARPGAMLGIVGPNGSGKSTLLRLLSGVVTPCRGCVLLHGQVLQRFSPREIARAVAVVPQDTAVEFPFTVAEVVLMGRTARLSGFGFESQADLRVARSAMERTGVADLADRHIQEVSGGERQRVVIARALAQEAEVLLLDEPTAFLDIRHEVEIYDLLRDVLDEGKAVVSVLHDLNLAALYCDEVLLLDEGRVVGRGAPERVLTYATLTQVYRTEIYVAPNDITGTTNVLPLSRPFREQLRHAAGTS